MGKTCVENCIYCGNEFEEKKKGYKRFSLNANISENRTVSDHLAPSQKENEKAFVCHTCFSLFKQLEILKNVQHDLETRSQKRKSEEGALKSPPAKRRLFTSTPKKTIKTTYATKKTMAMDAVKRSKYLSAMNYIGQTKSGQAAVQKYLKKKVKTEVKKFIRKQSPFSQEVNQSNIESFSWEDFLEEAEAHLPTLYVCVQAAVGAGLSKTQSKEGKKPLLGTMLGLTMYANKPKKFKFLQTLNSLQMWTSGCRNKLYQCFQPLGICLGYKGTISNLDRVRNEFDKEIRSWKESIELDMQTHRHEDLSDDEAGDVKNPSYSLCWDNVQMLTETRHQAKDRQNKMIMWANSYAVQNRISFRHLDDKEYRRAVNFPLQTFLPQGNDYSNLRMRMEVLVMRIIKEYFPIFSNNFVVDHIPHQYSEESIRKSRVVNLGVIEANPSSTAGVIQIMDNLTKYVPGNTTDKVFPLLCHGDGLSVERMVTAKSARANAATDGLRLEGLVPTSQEFHKRALLLQDTFDELYSPHSAADKGTLYQIRNLFNHRNVKKSVIHSFNHVEDLMFFTTQGLTCLLALHIMGIASLHETPPDFEEEDKDSYLLNLARKVVQEVFHETPQSTVEEVLDAEEANEEDEDDYVFFDFCFCNEDNGLDMIQCANPICPNGRWFHLPCIGLTEETVPEDDWWCSDGCESSGRSRHCICKAYLAGECMISCSEEDKCKNAGQYHLSCLGLVQKPGKSWVCDWCLHSKKSQQDHIKNYSRYLLWRGLLNMSHRDAERENDGLSMVAHWRLDMLEFYHNNHTKYLILGHRLIAGAHGWLPSRLREATIWNRTANLKGGLGHNLPLDLVNEFLNCDFKGQLQASKGRITDKQAERASQFAGTLSKDLDKTYQCQVAQSWVCRRDGGTRDYHEDVESFVAEYLPESLFDHIPGREHSAFRGYMKDTTTVARPDLLKRRLNRYCKWLDRSRDILPLEDLLNQIFGPVVCKSQTGPKYDIYRYKFGLQ